MNRWRAAFFRKNFEMPFISMKAMTLDFEKIVCYAYC